MNVSPATQERLMLSILDAWKEVPEVPWHISMAGWNYYARHESKEVREKTLSHPFCPLCIVVKYQKAKNLQPA